MATLVCCYVRVLGVPGIPTFNFNRLQLRKNIGRMSGESYHVICGTGVTCCDTYMYSHAWQKTILATKIRQALMESNVKSMKRI